MRNSFEQAVTPAFGRVDRNAPEIREALAAAPLYQKFGDFTAHLAEPGEQIETVLTNGRLETRSKIAEEGDWIVQNPGGEAWLVKKDIFLNRYKTTDTEGIYHATGLSRAIKNPFVKSVEILAEWNEPQNGDEHCWFMVTCDEDGNSTSEPYIVDNDSFTATYAPYKLEQ